VPCRDYLPDRRDKQRKVRAEQLDGQQQTSGGDPAREE